MKELILAVLFGAVISYFAVPGSGLFSWHPVCMSTGFLLLMVQGIFSFSNNPEPSFVAGNKRNRKVFIHWILQVYSSALISVGFITIYQHKVIMNKEHFTSWHGFSGLVSIILLANVMFGGIVNKYPSIVKFLMTVPTLRILHAGLAGLLFTSSVVTICLGLNSTWFNNVAPFPIPYLLMLILPIFEYSIVSQIYENRIKKYFSKN